MTAYSLTRSSQRDYLDDHIRDVPTFRALLRAVECRLFEEAGPLTDPVLDLGCGDGHYATIAFSTPLLVGIDPEAAMVREAHQRGAYRHAIVASATEMPFPSAFFNSVIANCVVEHIPDIETVLSETARVLRPGGRFIFGVPSENFTRMLLVPKLLRAAGLEEAAQEYGNWFNAHSQHFHTDSPTVWLERLTRHGFKVEHHEYYISEEAHQLFDVLHYLSVPRLISRKLTGRWTAFENPASQALFNALLRPHYDQPPPAQGAYIFFHARKQARL
ncbi:MAG: methyltransferase domain-containing protein [Ardenticatenales bacterium]|nr:methyltransferase domain-containing protein [Ardenticatenales bacterium]